MSSSPGEAVHEPVAHWGCSVGRLFLAVQRRVEGQNRRGVGLRDHQLQAREELLHRRGVIESR